MLFSSYSIEIVAGDSMYIGSDPIHRSTTDDTESTVFMPSISHYVQVCYHYACTSVCVVRWLSSQSDGIATAWQVYCIRPNQILYAMVLRPLSMSRDERYTIIGINEIQCGTMASIVSTPLLVSWGVDTFTD